MSRTKLTWKTRKVSFCACATYVCTYTMFSRDRDTLIISVCLARTRTLLSSMLIFHDSIFRWFFLVNVEICLYFRAVNYRSITTRCRIDVIYNMQCIFVSHIIEVICSLTFFYRMRCYRFSTILVWIGTKIFYDLLSVEYMYVILSAMIVLNNGFSLNFFKFCKKYPWVESTYEMLGSRKIFAWTTYKSVRSSLHFELMVSE